METIERLKKEKLVAVIRDTNPDNIIPIADSLLKGGIHALEITAETPNAPSLIEKVNKEFGDQLLIGAGTVLDPETAHMMIMAGARFIVSPTMDTKTIRLTKRYGVISIPGAFTPTEIVTAYESGADMVKIFPAGTVGASFVKNIKGPLPHIPLMVTGGIHFDNMLDYLSNGAEVVGIGSQLVNPKQLNHSEDYEQLTERATHYAEKVKNKIF